MRKPQADEISQGVNIIHDVTSANSDLKYVGFKVVDLTPGSAYTEDLKKTESLHRCGNGKNHRH